MMTGQTGRAPVARKEKANSTLPACCGNKALHNATVNTHMSSKAAMHCLLHPHSCGWAITSAQLHCLTARDLA